MLYRIERKPMLVKECIQYFPENCIFSVITNPDRTGMLRIKIQNSILTYILDPGDWIITELTGEVHACRVHNFFNVYERTGFGWRRRSEIFIGEQADKCHDIELPNGTIYHVHNGDWILQDTLHPTIVRERLFEHYYNLLGEYHG